ncbi:hypothetical protein MPSEU_000456800 [Mayamaea pseudoterrestris]|nr:hypothetical protein MPSEU_000456800 [Mayamaea pseudoterrestris]
MMFSSPRNHNEEDSVSMSIGSETHSEKIETTLCQSLGPDVRRSDVLCGRGKTSFNHSGNKWFRDAVSGSMDDYLRAENRFEKSLVVHNIMDRVKKEGGRFLKKDHHINKWVELSEPQAKEKVGHAVRDAVNALEGRKKKCKRIEGLSSSRGGESDGHLSMSPRTQQVRSVQNVLASFSSAAAERSDLPPRAPMYSFNDSASNLLPQMQSISLRPHSGVLDFYGYDTEFSRAPMTAQAGHSSWSGNTSNPSASALMAVRHRSLPHGSSHHGSSHDYLQSEQILRRQQQHLRAMDPLGIEQQMETPMPIVSAPQASPIVSSAYAREHQPPATSTDSRPIDLMDVADHDDNFLDKISSVLGPMYADGRAIQSMETYIHEDGRTEDDTQRREQV